MKKEKVVRTSMYAAVLIFLILFLVFSVLAAVTFGNADLSLKDVYSVILYKLFHIRSLGAYGEGAIHDVVWLIRLPRVLLALAIGMALSVCGVVMQAIVQNPLADPYVLGISSGASYNLCNHACRKLLGNLESVHLWELCLLHLQLSLLQTWVSTTLCC